MSWKSYFRTLHTRQLAMRESLYALGGSMWMDENNKKESTVTLADIKEILSTRPHILNNKEAKEMLRAKAIRGH